MNQMTEESKPKTNMEQLKEDATDCGPGCSCNAGVSGRGRMILGVIILVVAGVFVARAAMKDSGEATQTIGTEFAMTQSVEAARLDVNAQGTESNAVIEINETDDLAETATVASLQDAEAPKTEGPIVSGELIRSLGDLNQKAMDKDGVFLFLAGEDAAKNREIVSIVQKGVATLGSSKINMGTFTLAEGSNEFENLSKQVSPPCVLAMARGRGAAFVNDDITEAKLMQAFLSAANAGGGCCPGGASAAACN